MRLLRFSKEGKVDYGLVEKDCVKVLNAPPFTELTVTGETFSLDEIKVLAPCVPTKVIGVGLNYRDHARELSLPLPSEPILFLKPPSAVIGPRKKIIRPLQCRRLDYEAELAVIIGKEARNVRPENAREVILGYTCGNDVTARDLQPPNGQWTIAKSFDTFCPLGPEIVTGINSGNLKVALYLNGEKRQESTTAQLVFSVEELVSYVSWVMTLLPGDVILTGTPGGVGPMEPGDEVVVEIEGIEKLVNTVSAN